MPVRVYHYYCSTSSAWVLFSGWLISKELLGSVYTKRQRQLCDNAAMTLAILFHWKQWSRLKMGCKPNLEWLHCYQWEQNCKRRRSVDAELMLTLGINGPLLCRNLDYSNNLRFKHIPGLGTKVSSSWQTITLAPDKAYPKSHVIVAEWCTRTTWKCQPVSTWPFSIRGALQGHALEKNNKITFLYLEGTRIMLISYLQILHFLK